MVMVMMMMTDPFTTNLVVKGPVVKGSVVKGATSFSMSIVIIINLSHPSFKFYLTLRVDSLKGDFL